jgi:hypothetical protein
MNEIGNYTAIYGNMIYTVNDVNYVATNERRLFYKIGTDGKYSKLVLSIPNKGSIIIKIGEGVSMSVNKDIQTPDIVETTNVKKVVNNNDSNEVEAFAAGAVVGAILF